MAGRQLPSDNRYKGEKEYAPRNSDASKSQNGLPLNASARGGSRKRSSQRKLRRSRTELAAEGLKAKETTFAPHCVVSI